MIQAEGVPLNISSENNQSGESQKILQSSSSAQNSSIISNHSESNLKIKRSEEVVIQQKIVIHSQHSSSDAVIQNSQNSQNSIENINTQLDQLNNSEGFILNNSGNPSVTAQSYLQNYLERENGLAGTSSFNAPHNSENITGETSYYSSYSDSYSSENAILIEPPVKPPVQSNSSFNPRNQKFKPRQNPFPFSKPNYNLFTQKQISDLVNAALNHRNLDIKTFEEFETLIDILSKKRTKFAAEHNYIFAQQFQLAISYVRNKELCKLKNEAKNKASGNFTKKIEVFQQSFKQFDEETKDEEEKLYQEIKEQKLQLKNRHQQEIQKLEELWSSKKKMRNYNRPSRLLSTLRRQLNFLLTQCRFEEAQALQIQIDAQSKLEEQQNHERMQHDFNEVLKKLKEKQASEKKLFKENSRVKITAFEQKRKRLRIGFENRERKMNVEKDLISNPNKLWASTQNQRINEDSNIRRPPMKPTTRISRQDIYEKEVVTLVLPPLSMPRPKRKSKSKRPMRSAKSNTIK